MPPVNEFEAAIHSLGEHVVDMIGPDRLSAVRISGDERLRTAEVEVTLADPSWEEMERAIDRMVDLRAVFFGDVFVSYCFTEPNPGSTAKPAAVTPELEFA